MNGFVDIHCHMLPCVDDGPHCAEQAQDMLRIAQADGIGEIAVTPHFALEIPGFHAPWNEKAFKILSLYAKKLDIQLHMGGEIRLDKKALQALEEGACKPLGTGRHILLELPDHGTPVHMHAELSAFLSAGWIPVLAHVERLTALQTNLDALNEWVEEGCLLQVNASSLLGSWRSPTARTARKLVRQGRCHVVATDAHSPLRRPPLMQEAYRKVSKWIGESAAQDLFRHTPKRIIGLA